MNKGVIAAGAAVVAAVAVSVFVLPQVMKKDVIEEMVAPPVVQVVSPQIGDIEISRSLIGTVEPSDLVYVIPKAAGEITAVYANVGDYVEEGQLLCEIDTRQVDSAKLQLEAAEVQLNDANANLDRMRVLYQSGDIAAQAFEQVESSAKAAQIQYDSAKLAYDYQLEFSQITATIPGRIESSSMEVHSMASQTNPLCVISGEGMKTISFAVTEALLDQVKQGEPITIEKSGSQYDGTITEVSTMVDSMTGLFKVKATVEGGDALVSGSSVRLYVVSDRAEGVLSIPVDCVYYSGGKPFVYTYDNGVVHQVDVETGISDDIRMEIVSGLSASDQVITTWSPELYENAPAVLDSETSVTTVGSVTVETVESNPEAEGEAQAEDSQAQSSAAAE